MPDKAVADTCTRSNGTNRRRLKPEIGNAIERSLYHVCATVEVWRTSKRCGHPLLP
jgi:hypothetical protein